MYIEREPNDKGAYPPLSSLQINDMLDFPEEFRETFQLSNGFVILTIEDDVITNVVENVEAHQAWLDETAADRTRQAKEARIKELKQFLADTDYVIIKISEGVATKEEYAEIIAQRQAAREELQRYT